MRKIKDEIIIEEIEKLMDAQYYIWTIGITGQPKQMKQKCGNPPSWHHWNAGAEQTAQEITLYFSNKGCKGGRAGGASPADSVYIFGIRQ